MTKGTLVRATEAVIRHVRAGLVPVPVGRPTSRTHAARTVSARPAKRTDSRRPKARNRSRRRKGRHAGIGTGVTVMAVLIFIGMSISRSTEPPAQQQPAATASVASPVVVPRLPAAPAPCVVQAGTPWRRSRTHSMSQWGTCWRGTQASRTAMPSTSAKR